MSWRGVLGPIQLSKSNLGGLKYSIYSMGRLPQFGMRKDRLCLTKFYHGRSVVKFDLSDLAARTVLEETSEPC